jgi:hypothetical protein
MRFCTLILIVTMGSSVSAICWYQNSAGMCIDFRCPPDEHQDGGRCVANRKGQMFGPGQVSYFKPQSSVLSSNSTAQLWTYVCALNLLDGWSSPVASQSNPVAILKSNCTSALTWDSENEFQFHQALQNYSREIAVSKALVNQTYFPIGGTCD